MFRIGNCYPLLGCSPIFLNHQFPFTSSISKTLSSTILNILLLEDLRSYLIHSMRMMCQFVTHFYTLIRTPIAHLDKKE